MASQVIFFRKNWADFEKTQVVWTATEASTAIAYCGDRSNRTSWGTNGSVDANNTQFTVNFNDIMPVDSLIFVKHNFKNFLVEYFNGAIWQTVQNVINSTDTTTYLSFPLIQAQQFRVTIYGTQVANSDKYLFQFIATQKIGKLNGWPVFKKPVLGRNITEQKVISGKSGIVVNVGFYAASLTVTNWKDASDLSVVETLYNISEGFLFWPCGGDQTQFSSVRQGYRLEDIFLCRCKNEFMPEFVGGLYQTGMNLTLDLVEVIT